MGAPLDSTHTAVEGVSYKFKTTLRDEDKVPFEPADVTSILARLVSLDDFDSNGNQQVINGRNDVEVKGQNGGTLSTGGAFVWLMSASDAAIIDEKRGSSRLLLTLKILYGSGGSRVGKTRHLIIVYNDQGA